MATTSSSSSSVTKDRHGALVAHLREGQILAPQAGDNMDHQFLRKAVSVIFRSLADSARNIVIYTDDDGHHTKDKVAAVMKTSLLTLVVLLVRPSSEGQILAPQAGDNMDHQFLREAVSMIFRSLADSARNIVIYTDDDGHHTKDREREARRSPNHEAAAGDRLRAGAGPALVWRPRYRVPPHRSRDSFWCCCRGRHRPGPTPQAAAGGGATTTPAPGGASAACAAAAATRPRATVAAGTATATGAAPALGAVEAEATGRARATATAVATGPEAAGAGASARRGATGPDTAATSLPAAAGAAGAAGRESATATAWDTRRRRREEATAASSAAGAAATPPACPLPPATAGGADARYDSFRRLTVTHSHPRTFTPSYIHTCTPSLIHTFTLYIHTLAYSDPRTFTHSHPLTFTP
ncbi:uncharacterized protein LOC134541394 [Bacillus rossius redtenbacheri]|uniref:uncharacterized protein LOC134541394 n=1 Tax=Bacillus rossius redtenbacheri TaxID=93214 RepID=UPI002FDD0F1E